MYNNIKHNTLNPEFTFFSALTDFHQIILKRNKNYFPLFKNNLGTH